MNEEFIQGLQHFQQQALNLQNMMTNLQSQMPEGAEGTDAQGAVTIRLASDGLPESIKAASDWQRRQPPESIGAVVVEAYGAAMSAQMEDLSRSLDESDWQTKADRMDDSLAAPGPFGAEDAPSAAAEFPHPDLRYVVPRSLDEVTEDMLSAFGAVEQLASVPPEPVQATGKSTAHRVVLTVAKGGLVSCEVDPQWAKQQSSIGLNQAFEEALAEAREKLRAAEATAGDGVANLQLGSLLNEALAILSDPRRLAD
uniref:YbaB/EbfC DNA-binding family protein n=1 Tax=Streptomyces sp. NBC_00008 TaxID=2903610 RepID=A0AAU2VT38_9ACTN